MATYLKQFYFDDWKLRQRIILEFLRALQTGRMIAFTGSLSTEPIGYGSWGDLVDKYVKKGSALADSNLAHPSDAQREGFRAACSAIENVKAELASGGSKALHDKRVALSIVKEALRVLDELAPCRDDDSRVKQLDDQVSKDYSNPPGKASGVMPPIKVLLDDLGIRRFATLNYDLELEYLLMRMGDDESRDKLLEGLRTRNRNLDPAPVPGRLHRLMLDGSAIESDIRNRERPDRMIDFAVGSVDADRRVMHLHGRACTAESLIVGLRDYDRLYRKDDRAKLPFEHGQRILFGGNPVLFIGVGMTEPELNATLQAFVSNNPYRRFAPTFLLWNTWNLDGSPEFGGSAEIAARQMAMQRIDFLQRLGVFMIFDDDLLSLPSGYADFLEATRKLQKEYEASGGDQPPTLRRNKQELLTQSISALGKTAKLLDEQVLKNAKNWRTMDQRIERIRKMDEKGRPKGTGKDDKFVRLWGATPGTQKKLLTFSGLARPPASPDEHSHAMIVSEIGAGKGTLGRMLAEADLPKPFDVPAGMRLLVSAGFSFDTDSLLGMLSKMLHKLKVREGGPVSISRETQFAARDAFDLDDGPMLVVLTAMERFFNVHGAPLSAELDHLLRCIAGTPQGPNQIRWLFLGSERIRRYFNAISPAAINDFTEVCAPVSGVEERMKKVNGLYLSSLPARFEAYSEPAKVKDLIGLAAKMELKERGSGDHDARRRGVLSAYLHAEVLEKTKVGNRTKANLCMEILRAMAFIGQPVEAVVLLHAPRIRKALTDVAADTFHPDRLHEALRQLVSLGLVLEIHPFEGNPTPDKDDGKGKGDPAAKEDEQGAGATDGKSIFWRRYGLHRSIISHLRYQFGVPLSESKLSTAFNMSLYVAQPVDGHVPEPEIHDELASLIDHLIGSYKDDPIECEKADLSAVPDAQSALRAVGESLVPPLPAEELARLEATCSPSASAALRAALSVVRGYYSTTSLLTIDRSDRLASDDRDGVLLEHAERLERLLRIHSKLSRFREAILTKCARIEDENTRKRAEEQLGAEPFYPDDIVWIHNELGVVYLAQGDLYSARRAFRQASRLNSETVEYRCRSHNWRRITLNEVLVDIERARLSAAEQRLDDIERSINERPDLRRGHERRPPQTKRFARIRKLFGSQGGSSNSCFDGEIMHEEILMTGLVLGFRALDRHIRGQLEVARPLYSDALAILRRLGEQRAYASFQRHYAELVSVLDSSEQSRMQTRFAVAAAESVRQMDMAYHARITGAEVLWLAHPSDAVLRRRALDQADEALGYAAVMDIYRLRIEANVRLARLKLDSGDHETAFEHATEAMTLAARFGHSLRKIAIRILIGRILIRRGDRQSGEALIDSAAEAADRFGYQGAVERARRARPG